MKRLGWLHLSDLHYGFALGTPLFRNMAEDFYDDLEHLHAESGPWHVVFFTGDLAQQGTHPEYTAFENEVLSPLLARLKAWGSEPAVVCVPGNHDLVRPPADSAAVTALLGVPKARSHLFAAGTEGQEYRNLVADAFKPYATWFDARRPAAAVRSWTPGRFPGEFYCVLEINGIRLGIVGLNTAIVHFTDEFKEGTLALSASQFHAVVPEPSRMTADTDFRVLLTHHPISWVTKEDQREFEAEIAPPSRFTLHLHGHMHEPTARSLSVGGSAPRQVLQGASWMGLEKLADGSTRRIHGYSAGQFVPARRIVTRIWPRIATLTRGGARRFGPDPEFELDRKTQSFTYPPDAEVTDAAAEQWAESVPFVKVPWDDVFAGAKTLDVVTNYADSWLQTHMDALRRFLAKDGALTLALPDPVDSVCVSTLLLRYPEHATNPRALLSKVTETAKRLFRVADDLGATQRLKVVLLRAPPSYWGLRADSKLIYLSPFEFRRKERVQSPVFRIRPAADTPESEFWSKEFNFEASAGARVITKDDPALHELEGEPAARVRRITNRQSVYECAERLIKKAKRKVYDTSWGFRPPEQHRHEAHPFRKGYRAAIVTCADASEPRVSYREIIGAGYDERVERARDVLRQLADVKEHSYEPRLVSVPLDLPLLEYIVVDDCEMLLSGLGAASDEFLLIEGGALPGMISSYLERVWNSGKPIT